jgi:predicted alpha/beta hydrolase family esterase
MNTKILIIPGYDNSGPGHWQTLWEKDLPNATRVNQKDWLRPIKSEWVETLDRAIQKEAGSKLLVAHSLGCHAVVEWAANHKGDIKGALLVAPPDLEALEDPALIELAKTWMSLSRKKLSFPAILVASSSDQYTKIQNSEKLARRWGCRFVNIGDAGHINVDSGHGPWEEGKRYLGKLLT